MSLPISSIAGIPSIPAADQLTSAASQKGTGSGADFGSALKSAIEGVDKYQQDANTAVQQFLKGNGELHNVALATQRAEMALDLGLQVRNKVVSAYQEIMKMSL
jgi:flagellar hook-basal body complex protein FliE